MICERFQEANLQQQVMILPQVQLDSPNDTSMRARWPQIPNHKADELKERVSVLYEAYRDRIYSFLIKKGLNATTAQDITQDVFVDLFLAIEKGARIESEQRWLYAVAGRTALDHWRRKRCRMQIDFELESSAAVDVPSSAPTPEVQVEHKQRLNRVAAGLRKLPNEQRWCIQLRAQGMHYREIAEVLRISTSTAAEWITSAINKLGK